MAHTRVLHDATLAALEDLPRYYHHDPHALAVLDALSREKQRIEDFLVAIRTQFFPQNATDTYGILSAWESMLGLPVAPAGSTEAQRRLRVQAAWRKRKSGKGSDWVDNVTTYVGSSSWSYTENSPSPHTLSVSLPFASNQLNGSHTLPQATITVDSTTGFSDAGNLLIGGSQSVAYTGKTATTFTGCTGGTGNFADNTSVVQGDAASAGTFIRTITPAHIVLIVGYSSGFLVDISKVDQEPL